jgi:putative oxidoreductase
MNANVKHYLFSTQAGAWGITVLRAVVGATFMMHGWEKLYAMGIPATAEFFGELGVPAPTLAAAGVGGLELVGGLALIFGLLTRLVAIPLAADMVTAIVLVHLPMGFFVADGGFEHALLLMVSAVALALNGSGAFALDSFVGMPQAVAERIDEMPLAQTH